NVISLKESNKYFEDTFGIGNIQETLNEVRGMLQKQDKQLSDAGKQEIKKTFQIFLEDLWPAESKKQEPEINFHDYFQLSQTTLHSQCKPFPILYLSNEKLIALLIKEVGFRQYQNAKIGKTSNGIGCFLFDVYPRLDQFQKFTTRFNNSIDLKSKYGETLCQVWNKLMSICEAKIKSMEADALDRFNHNVVEFEDVW